MDPYTYIVRNNIQILWKTKWLIASVSTQWEKHCGTFRGVDGT